MFNYYLKNIKWDKDLSKRQKRIDLYTRVYNGTIYDHLEYFFFQERENGMNGNYIPIILRQPSVKINFCKLVADNSVSLLFGSEHFPKVMNDDPDLKATIADIVECYKLNKVMIRAATIGSTGSVVLLVCVIDNKLSVKSKNTKYMTPIFDKQDNLVKLIERYKVSGKQLVEQGYTNIEDQRKDYWFHREWDDAAETYYLPYCCDDKTPNIKVDIERTTIHNLGFVPAIWIRNLPKIIDSDDEGICIDGECTYASAIDAGIEIDYQLSQAGRALKYSADPLLVLKLEDEMTLQGNMTSAIDMVSGQFVGSGSNRSLPRSASNALMLSQEDEAKLLEINGEACKAVLEYVKHLREYLLETIHGTRTTDEKLNTVKSGTAMKAMNQELIWLTDKLRVSYGDGYLQLIEMIIAISNSPGCSIIIEGKNVSQIKNNQKLKLAWPEWYPNTPADNVQNANALKTLSDAAILSKKTGTEFISEDFNINNIDSELSEIRKDVDATNALNPKLTEIKNV